MMDGFYLIDFAFLFTLAFTGSLHCAGMCGGISCAYAIPVHQNSPKLLWKYHGAYFTGRLLAYTMIGAIMGGLGMTLAVTVGPNNPFQFFGAAVAGLVMVLGGAATLVGQSWPERISQWVYKIMKLFVPKLQSQNRRLQPWSVLPLGLLSGILPCGLMWAVELRAFATNSMLWGAVTMIIFSVITSVSVFASPTVLTKISPYLRFRSVQIASLMVMGMGVYLIWKHSMHPEKGLEAWLNCLPRF